MKRTELKRKSGLPRAAGPKRQSAPKRTQPKREWTFARRKVEEEGACRICGDTRDLHAAHILGREHDKKRLNGDREFGPLWFVEPVRVVPLGGEFGCGCHGRYDRHEVDLLPVLTLDEQLQAVKDAGGLEHARLRTAPTAYETEALARGAV